MPGALHANPKMKAGNVEVRRSGRLAKRGWHWEWGGLFGVDVEIRRWGFWVLCDEEKDFQD